MRTLTEIRNEIKDLRPAVVARATGLHYNTIRNVRDKPDHDPRWSVLEALDRYLDGRGEANESDD